MNGAAGNEQDAAASAGGPDAADAARRGRMRTGKVGAADDEEEELLEYDDMDHCPRQLSSAGWAGSMAAASAGAAGAVPCGQSGGQPPAGISTGISSTASTTSTSTSVRAYAAPPSVPPPSQGSLRGVQQPQQPQPPRWDQPAAHTYPGAANSTSTGHGPGRGSGGGTSRREQAERLVRDRQVAAPAATAAAAALVVAAGVAGLAYRLGQAAIGRVEVVDPNAPDEHEQEQEQEQEQQQEQEEAEAVGLPTVNLKKKGTAVDDRKSFLDGSADGRRLTHNLTDLDEFQEAPEHMRPVVESVELFVAAPGEAVGGTAAALASASIDTNSIGIQTSIPVAGTAVGTVDASVQTSVQVAQAAVQTSVPMPAPAAAALVTATAVAETAPPPVLEAPVFHIGRDGLRVSSEKLGRGAYGMVRGGRFSGTEVAVKLQIRGENETPEVVQRKQEEFEREVAVLLHLRHPNIVLLYGVDPTKNALLVERAVSDLYHCIQSPLFPPYSEAPGGTLWGSIASAVPWNKEMQEELILLQDNSVEWKRTKLKAQPKGTWPLQLIVKVAFDIARGLDFLHARGYSHNDLKSLNLLVFENYCCKISDLGMTKESSKKLNFAHGTYRWWAPEIVATWNGQRRVPPQTRPYPGQPADVWAFGIILLEILTKNIPYPDFDDKDVVDFIWAQSCCVANGSADVVHPIPDSCPIFLRDIIIECTKVKYAERATFAVIVERLKTMMKVVGDHR